MASAGYTAGMQSDGQPLVSVCLPVFNGARFIESALRSLLAQTYGNFEAIVSDDGSSDGTRAIVEKFARSDGRIRLLEPCPRQGLFQNYNRCFEAARGPLIKPFAQDDLLSANFIETAVSVLNTYPSVSLVSVARECIDDDGRTIHGARPKQAIEVVRKSEPIPGNAVIKQSVLPVVNFIGEPSAVMFRRSRIGKGFDPRFHHLGDLCLWLQILSDSVYFFHPEALCKFRLHSKSQTSRNEESLSFVPDIVLMWHVLKELPAARSIGEERYFASNIPAVTGHIQLLLDTQKIDGSLLSNGALRDDERYLWRDALLQTVKQIYDADANSQMHNQLAYYSVVIRKRESQLKQLYRNFGWRLTRPFRELNKLLLAVDDEDPPAGLSAKKSGLHDRVSAQKRYLHYLRRQIIAVRRSRSWRLSRMLTLSR